MILLLAIAGIILAAIPALMFLWNLPLFAMPIRESDADDASLHRVSVLIPARDEESGIESCVRSALACRAVQVEVIVLDDQSTDQTSVIVRRLADEDSRVHYLLGSMLPPGWNGKQYACHQLANAATQSRYVFLDADVRLRPNAVRRLADYQDENSVALVSAFPQQETGTWLETWLVPMMHVILLGYLPLRRMRGSTHESYAAGCGQLFMTTQESYQRAGGHEAIKASRHDGLKLPRAYRQADLMTDVVDGTTLATCRMYHSAGEVVRGVLKNAHEGIGNARLIVPFSIFLVGSAVLPVVVFVWAVWSDEKVAALLAGLAVLLGHLPRAMAAIRFRQSAIGVLFHSPAALSFVTLQWLAYWMSRTGRSIAWRGRAES